MKEYIEVGKLNKEIFSNICKELITEDVIFTFERVNHVETKRLKLFDEVRNIIPEALYNPDRIYKDWNNRKNTFVIIKSLDEESKLNIILRIAIENDEKHPKNSIITMIKIGKKHLRRLIIIKKIICYIKKKTNSNILVLIKTRQKWIINV